jgi:hypothetical protein
LFGGSLKDGLSRFFHDQHTLDISKAADNDIGTENDLRDILRAGDSALERREICMFVEFFGRSNQGYDLMTGGKRLVQKMAANRTSRAKKCNSHVWPPVWMFVY